MQHRRGWSVIDSLYFSVTTLTTVGSQSLAPGTTVGKIFTMVHIFAGPSIILGFVDAVAKETPKRNRGDRDRRAEADQEDASAAGS